MAKTKNTISDKRAKIIKWLSILWNISEKDIYEILDVE